MKNLKLGSSVHVLDPCYIPNSMHMELKIDIPAGEWEPYIEMSDEGSWGNRVSTLGITRSGFHTGFPKVVGYAGVDSGQMMIIDSSAIDNWESCEVLDEEKGWHVWKPEYASKDMQDEEFVGEFSYYGACNATLGPEQSGILDELAVVSSSGYGDGSYPVYVYEKDGQVERIEVRFIEEEEEWEDEWDEEDEEVEDEW